MARWRADVVCVYACVVYLRCDRAHSLFCALSAGRWALLSSHVLSVVACGGTWHLWPTMGAHDAVLWFGEAKCRMPLNTLPRHFHVFGGAPPRPRRRPRAHANIRPALALGPTRHRPPIDLSLSSNTNTNHVCTMYDCCAMSKKLLDRKKRYCNILAIV